MVRRRAGPVREAGKLWARKGNPFPERGRTFTKSQANSPSCVGSDGKFKGFWGPERVQSQLAKLS